MLVGAATVFTVRNLAASVAHYRDVLGFDVTFQYGDPPFYACLCRDEVSLHLRAPRDPEWVPGNGAICVFVSDVDACMANLPREARMWSSRRRITPMGCAISTLP